MQPVFCMHLESLELLLMRPIPSGILEDDVPNLANR